MSTQYSEYEIKETVKCKICNGNFVPGGVRFKLPDYVCLWCYTRSGGGFNGPGAVYRRFMLLWKGLSAMAQLHGDDFAVCNCEGCKIYRIALPIMEPGATMQASETKP